VLVEAIVVVICTKPDFAVAVDAAYNASPEASTKAASVTVPANDVIS